MKSPCLLCAVHILGGDKNCTQCRDCQKRVDYVRAIGGWAPAPAKTAAMAEPAPARQNQKEEPVMETTQATKICRRADCPHGGKPQPIDNFAKNKIVKGGHENTCKTCRVALAKNRRHAVQAQSRQKNSAPAPKKRKVLSSNAATLPKVETHTAGPNDFARLSVLLAGSHFDRGQLMEISDLCAQVFDTIDTYLQLDAIFNGRP